MLQKMRELESERKQTIGKARIGGPWELVGMDGKLGGSEQLKGNWLLLYFGFTHCPDVCPDSIEKMVEVCFSHPAFNFLMKSVDEQKSTISIQYLVKICN